MAKEVRTAPQQELVQLCQTSSLHIIRVLQILDDLINGHGRMTIGEAVEDDACVCVDGWVLPPGLQLTVDNANSMFSLTLIGLK